MDFLTQLDLRTLFFALILVLVFLTLELIVVMMQNKAVLGVKLWIMGVSSCVLGLVIWLVFSNHPSLFLKVVMSNVITTGGIAIINMGIVYFFALRNKFYIEAGLMAGLFALFNYFSFVDNNHPVRVVCMSHVGGILLVRQFSLLFSQRKAPYVGRTVFIASLFSGFLALGYFSRGLFYIGGMLDFYALPLQLYQKSAVTAAFIVICLLGMIGLVMSFISLLWGQSLAALEQEKNRVEIANRAKYDFLSNMSHELRTPLNSVIGFGRLLLDNSQLNEDQRSFVNIMVNAGKHQLKLINEILDFAKIDSGNFQLDTVPFNLTILLNNVWLMIQKDAHMKGVALSHALVELPDFVVADPVRLQQVLLNLLSNAIKFSPDGKVFFAVFADPLSAAVNSVSLTFAVSDNGPGIPSDKLMDIQNAFEQVPTIHAQDGVGLGLSITRNLLQKMNSCLCISSQIEGHASVSNTDQPSPLPLTASHGTVVWFTLDLPLEASDSCEIKATEKIVSFIGTMPDILIVDDNVENRELLGQLLRSVGIYVRQADSAVNALQAIESQQPDLLITDLRMPDMDGFNLMQLLKEKSEMASMKIICSSATIDDYTVNQALALGADAFLPKPVDKEELFNLMDALLDIEWRYDLARA